MKLLLSVLIWVTILSTMTIDGKKPKPNNISAKPSKPSSITKPKPNSISAYAKFDSLQVSNRECINCLRENCPRCIRDCIHGPPATCFACILWENCPCLVWCGYPKTSDAITEAGLWFDPVNIVNTLPDPVLGEIHYVGCKSDIWSAPANGEYTGPEENWCLVLKITAYTGVLPLVKDCIPYTANPVNYRKFGITLLPNDTCIVSPIPRLVN